VENKNTQDDDTSSQRKEQTSIIVTFPKNEDIENLKDMTQLELLSLYCCWEPDAEAFEGLKELPNLTFISGESI